MSYDISSWKITNVHLELPLKFDFRSWLQKQPDKDAKGYATFGKRFCLEDERSRVLCDLVADTWQLSASGCALSGVIQDQKLILADPDAINWDGDGSGYLYHDVLIPLFKDFQGDLEAIVIWEHGDSVRQLKIVQGVVSDEKID